MTTTVARGHASPQRPPWFLKGDAERYDPGVLGAKARWGYNWSGYCFVPEVGRCFLLRAFILACGLLLLSAGAVLAAVPKHLVKPEVSVAPALAEAAAAHEIPNFVLDDSGPWADELLQWNAAKTLAHVDTMPGGDAAEARNSARRRWGMVLEQDIHDALAIVGQLRVPATYAFLGNGMYGIYLAARGIFHGTPMSHKLLFMPISKSTPDDPSRAQGLGRLFDLLHLEQREGNLVLVDTKTASYGWCNAILRYSQSVRRHLLRHGEPLSSVLHRVIALGINEQISFAPHDRNSTDTVDAYRAAFKGTKTGDWDNPRRGFTHPFIAARLNLAGFSGQWHDGGPHAGRDFYWAGKYRSIDERGIPVGDRGVSHHSELTPPITARVVHALTYKSILEDHMSRGRLTPLQSRQLQTVVQRQRAQQ